MLVDGRRIFGMDVKEIDVNERNLVAPTQGRDYRIVLVNAD